MATTSRSVKSARVGTAFAVASVTVAAITGARYVPTAAASTRPQQRTCITAVACQRVAKSAFDAEMARVGVDCPTAQSQREENACQQAAERRTTRNYAAFASAVESVVGDTAWHKADQAWTSYRKSQCDAVFDFYRPGTIAPSARSRCMMELTRSRMRDLNTLFDTPLHH